MHKNIPVCTAEDIPVRAKKAGRGSRKKVMIPGSLDPGSARFLKKVKKVVIFYPRARRRKKNRTGPGLSVLLTLSLITLVSGPGFSLS